MGRRLSTSCLIALIALFLQLPFAPVAQAAAYRGAWSPTGSLHTAREWHTSTLLPDGRVLVTGGGYQDPETGESYYLDSAELYDPTSGVWNLTAPMSAARGGHTATLLLDGRVLVAGGEGSPGASVSAEIYDPVTENWSPTGSLGAARVLHTATLLTDGRVLAAGGLGAGVLASTEIYDPATGAWSSTGLLATSRHLHTATLLLDGRVLVVGGHDGSGFVASAEVYDPAAGVWSPAGELNTGRWLHTATLLPDGRVLVAGGYDTSGALAETQLYDPTAAPGSAWSTTGAMTTNRAMHTASLLPDGRVLVAGGSSSSSHLPGAEVYDPAAGTWSLTGSMATQRAVHSATLLVDGRVLVAGGTADDSHYLASAEVYDPAAPGGPWTPTGTLGTARCSHTTTLLADGRVLVAGGFGNNSYLATAETYDPVTGKWSPTASLSTARSHHTATLLADGRVLVAGGRNNNSRFASAEIYDPATGTWTAAGSMSVGRAYHTATLLADGRVLVAGGNGSTGTLKSAELYDPITNAWSSAGSMTVARRLFTATLLPDGQVLMAGNSVQAELFNPSTVSWSLTGVMGVSRIEHTATLLADGRVLVAGGFGNSQPLTSAELYDSATGTWSPTGSLGIERYEHSATLLPDGQVLVAGGYGNGNRLATVELYDPSVGTWGPAATMALNRCYHSATLLADGRLLVAGGQDDDELTGVEVYDPGQPAWILTGLMSGSRDSHTATLLPDGQVLAAGGRRYEGDDWFTLDSAETYNPELGTWIETTAMHSSRSGHTATLLPGGPVLVTGGWHDGALASTELYYPASETWSVTGPMDTARTQHTATLLPDGRVLAAGGDDGASQLAGAEVYNPMAGTWTPTGSMSTARASHTATLLPDGRVLVAGGYSASLGWLSGAELYDPVTGMWSPTGSMVDGRGRHTAALLPDGRVLVAGGMGLGDVTLASAEVYDPASGSWSTTGSMADAREGHQAILLPDGSVLVTGGSDSGGGHHASTEVYDPATEVWSLDAPLSAALANYGLTLLADGRLLRTGGFGGDGSVASAELYDRGLGFDPAWRPSLAAVTSPLLPGSALTIAGSGFRGYGLTEASGGATRNSATNYPLVQLRRLDNGQVRWLLPDPDQPFSAATFTALPITGLSGGPHLVTVFVNGIASLSRMIYASEINLPPIAHDDAYSTDEDVALQVAAPGVLGNDLDFNGDELSAALVSQPMSGTLVLSADGSFVYTPSLNLCGTDLFTYQASDGVYTATAQAHITLRPINDPPVLDPIDDKAVDEEVTLSFIATAADPDIGDTLVFSIGPDAPDGASIDPATGLFAWTPSEAQGPSVYTVTVRVADDGTPPLDDYESFHITVSEVNQAPVLGFIDDKSVDESTLLSFTATATDADLPPNSLTFSLDASAPVGASIDPATGLFAWTPSEAQGPEQYVVTIHVADDGQPVLDDSEAFTVTVYEVNQAPVATDDAYATDAATPLNVVAPGVLGNDLDGDLPVQTLTATLEIDPLHGILALNPDGSFLYTPAPAFYGFDAFTYTVSDGDLTDTAVVSLTIRAVCDLALAKTVSAAEVWPGASLTYTLTVTNTGPSGSTAITVTDWLPAGETLLAASPSCSASGSIVTCLPGSLPAGETIVLTLTVTVGVTATGVLSNVAVIAGAELDPEPANNVARVEVSVVDFYEIYLPLVAQDGEWKSGVPGAARRLGRSFKGHYSVR